MYTQEWCIVANRSQRISDCKYLDLQIIRVSRIIRGLLFSSVKNSLNFFGLPWKLVWKLLGLTWKFVEALAVVFYFKVRSPPSVAYTQDTSRIAEAYTRIRIVANVWQYVFSCMIRILVSISNNTCSCVCLVYDNTYSPVLYLFLCNVANLTVCGPINSTPVLFVRSANTNITASPFPKAMFRSRRPSVSWIFALKTFCLTDWLVGLGATDYLV